MASIPKVLCVTDYYLPGFKGGGPIRTLSNMVGLLKGDIEFLILTRDRDLGSGTAFPSVSADSCQEVNGTPIYYASPRSFGVRAFRKLRLGRNFDLVYLNSFFSFKGSIAINLYERVFAKDRLRILIAPRGEFSEGALGIKPAKKRLYLSIVKLLGLYRGVCWHASTEREAEDIRREFPGSASNIFLAADPVAIAFPKRPLFRTVPKVPGSLRMIFVSRLSPMKNLVGLLEMLAGVDRHVVLAIYGPIEDNAYWEKCQMLMKKLPRNIVVEYRGSLAPEQVSSTFAEHDIFVFPTFGENFGHVIYEALSAGTPVLVSDQTPWVEDATGALTVIPLNSFDKWRSEIDRAADRDADHQSIVSEAAFDYARRYAKTDATRADNLTMFREVADAREKKGS